jgi:hypothetical protein
MRKEKLPGIRGWETQRRNGDAKPPVSPVLL